jgi:hypothetical protein
MLSVSSLAAAFQSGFSRDVLCGWRLEEGLLLALLRRLHLLRGVYLNSMPTDWPPAAPDLGQHFADADRDFAYEPRRSHSSETVTIGQLEMLEDARSAPALEQHLRPGDHIETEVHRTLHLEREGEIIHVVDRLFSATEELRTDFDRSNRFDKDRNFDRAGRGRRREL